MLQDIIRGRKNIRGAIGDNPIENALLDTMGPVGVIFRGLGKNLPFIHNEPTTGTKFRDEFGRMVTKIPGFKDFSVGNYNEPKGGYTQFSPEALAAADELAGFLVPYSPSGKTNLEAYKLQARNLLLSKYGNDIVKRVAEARTAQAPQATPASPMLKAVKRLVALRPGMGPNAQAGLLRLLRPQPAVV